MPDDTTLIAPRDSIHTGNNKYRSKTSAVFILHKDTIIMNFFMKTVEDLNNPAYQSVIDQQFYLNTRANFTGQVLYFTLDRQFINGYLWQDGSITKTVSIESNTSTPSQTQKTRDKVINVATTCTTDVYEIVNITTVTTPYGSTTTVTPTGLTLTVTSCTTATGTGAPGTTTTTGGVSGSGGTTPTKPPCVAGSSSGAAVSSVKSGRLIVNVTTPPTGGSGGTTPAPQPCPTVVTTTPPTTTTPTTKNPCAEKATVSTRAANVTVANQNTQILSKSTTIEYGTDENLTNLSGNTYVNTPITTNNTADSWPPTFTWDSTNGYTIGWSHGHPGGSAPSPDDIFVMIGFLTDPALIKGGTSGIQFYRNNVSVTVVTKNGNYVATVNDWAALQTLYTKFTNDPNGFNSNYVQTGLNYLAANQGATDSDAGAYSLMTLFGSSINLYKAPTGSTSFTPLTIDNNKKVATKPCPEN